MKKTFQFSKTSVRRINRALATDDNATVWFDVCDGFARIRVDNVLLGENLLTVESQKVKMSLGENIDIGCFKMPRLGLEFDGDRSLSACVTNVNGKALLEWQGKA